MTPTDLPQALDRAVPDPPDLTGLAARAESAGRRSRARRRTAVGAGVVVVAAVAGSLTLGSRTPAPFAHEQVGPGPEVQARCARSSPERDPDRDAQPTSVRFCPPERRQRDGTPAALVPQLNLFTDVPATMTRLDAAVERASRAFCPVERNPYRIQVTSADGTVRQLSSQDCGNGYTILLEAIGRQASAGARPLLTPLNCQLEGPPDRSGDAAFPPYEPLLTLPAVQAVRCTTYAADMRARSEVEDPEELRAALLSDISTALLDCMPTGPRVTWVLRLSDGSIHTAGLSNATSCGHLDLDKKGLGVAGPILQDLAGS